VSYNSNQRVGVLASLVIHMWFLSLLLLLPAVKPIPVKTFYLSFVQQEGIVAAPQPEKVDVRRQKVLSPDLRRITNAPVEKKTAIPVDQSPVVPIPVQRMTPAPVASSGSGLRTAEQPVGTSGSAAAIGKRIAGDATDTRFGNIDAPRFIHRELPVYPHLARRMEREGRVVLRLYIDHTGRLLNVTVLEPAGYGFTEAAVEAVRKSTFAPANRNGEKVASRVILSVRFRLESE